MYDFVGGDTREIHVAGTYNRDRIVRVAGWAWPFVEELIDGRLPNMRLFQAIDRYRDKHDEPTVALTPKNSIYDGYMMWDVYHTWVVRAGGAD